MIVEDLISLLESNFFGHEKVYMFDQSGEQVEVTSDNVVNVMKSGGDDYVLIENEDV